MKNLLFFSFFLVLSACNVPPSGASRTPDERFRTTQPSRLYFKNMRAYYYDQEVQPGTKTDLYTLKKFSRATDRPLLIPVIADNWLQDEAYILLQPNAYAYFPEDTLHLKSATTDAQEMETFLLTDNTMEQQLALAEWLYEQLIIGHKISLFSLKNEWEEIFEVREDRIKYIKTLQDYLALIEKTPQ